MFERLNTPEEVFDFKLGSALTMEQKLVEMLEELEEHAHSTDIKRALREHREQTRRHVENVEQCFRVLGKEVDDSPCPIIEAMAKEGKATIRKTDDALVDNVICTAAAESEHHEIAVYEALITNAEAHGQSQVVELLRQNLRDEEHALELAKRSLRDVAGQRAAAARAA